MNVLLISVGISPAVVTETLWALLHPQLQQDPAARKHPRFVADLVHIVTTTFGRRRLEQLKIEDRIRALYRQEGEAPPVVRIDVPKDADGQEIQDINTQAENAAFADFMTAQVRCYMHEEDVNLHVSLAGGRKTMTSFTHAAMTFFGRPKDRLTHVLVDPPELERCQDFWWPGQPDADLFTTDGRPVSARLGRAHVELVETPYVRLRYLLDMSKLPNPISHGALVQAIQKAVEADILEVCPADLRVCMGGHAVKLPPREFALYHTLARALKERWPGAGPDGIGDSHAGWLTNDLITDPERSAVFTFLDEWERALQRTDLPDAKKAELLRRLKEWKGLLLRRDPAGLATLQNDIEQSVNEARSRINRQIRDASEIPAVMKERMKVHSDRRRGKSRFGLLLEPRQVRIVD